MDQNFLSERPNSAEQRDLQHRSPPSARLAYGTARRASATGLLLMSLGVWAAMWAALATLSSWLR
jgi:hypothetical protein